jgi:hypothetical protein
LNGTGRQGTPILAILRTMSTALELGASVGGRCCVPPTWHFVKGWVLNILSSAGTGG